MLRRILVLVLLLSFFVGVASAYEEQVFIEVDDSGGTDGDPGSGDFSPKPNDNQIRPVFFVSKYFGVLFVGNPHFFFQGIYENSQPQQILLNNKIMKGCFGEPR
jgi:hypothetical protein